MAPHEFNVVLRTTTDEFNVLPRTSYVTTGVLPYNCGDVTSDGVHWFILLDSPLSLLTSGLVFTKHCRQLITWTENPTVFRKWAPGEPDNSTPCVGISKSNCNYFDIDCSNVHSILCKRPTGEFLQYSFVLHDYMLLLEINPGNIKVFWSTFEIKEVISTYDIIAGSGSK